MKNKVLIALIGFACIISMQAQNRSGFGFKGGINYNANGNYYESTVSNAENPDRNIGYHIGVFYKAGNKIFLKPELVFTNTKSDYDSDSFNMQKIDAPLLVGVKFLKFFNVFGGPSLQYILDTDFDGISVNNVKNEFSVGLNFGVGVTLNKIGVDIRYERGLSENEAGFIGNNEVQSRIDTRPDQLILSVSLLL